MPSKYGPAITIYNRYDRWLQRGIWQRMFERLAASGDVPDELMLDSSHVKPHRPVSGAKGGMGASGRRLSRLSHAQSSLPGRYVLTPGNVADFDMAVPLPEQVTPPKRLIADKAYDADRLRRWLAEQRVTAVIPSTARRHTPYPLNRRAYRGDNRIEGLFCRLKNWRRVGTRYDRLARIYPPTSSSTPSPARGPYESPAKER